MYQDAKPSVDKKPMTVLEKGVERDGETSDSDELVKHERKLDKK